MNKRPSLAQFKTEALKDQHIQKEYLALEEEYALLEALIQARKLAKISQTELALKLATKQPAIARIEKGPLTKLSLQSLIDYARALGLKLQFNLIPAKK